MLEKRNSRPKNVKWQVKQGVNRIRWQSCPRAVLTRAHNCQSGVRLWISSPRYPTPAKPGVCDICSALHFCPPLSGLALMNDSGSAAVPSELRNLLRASWAFLGATPAGLLNLEPAFWGRNGSCFLPACSVFPSGHMLHLNGQQSRKGEVLYSLLVEAQPRSGFQQLFEFGDPNLLLTAMSSLPCNLLNWF